MKSAILFSKVEVASSSLVTRSILQLRIDCEYVLGPRAPFGPKRRVRKGSNACERTPINTQIGDLEPAKTLVSI
jgi:hypothetical protein